MKSQWEEKVWGSVCHIFQSGQAAVSYLKVNAGFQCSKHKHEQRANQFTVISGKIVVEIWAKRDGTGMLLSSESLQTGESIMVPSTYYHRFRVIESGEVVEIYWGDRGGAVHIDDIVRLDEGGPIGD